MVMTDSEYTEIWAGSGEGLLSGFFCFYVFLLSMGGWLFVYYMVGMLFEDF